MIYAATRITDVLVSSSLEFCVWGLMAMETMIFLTTVVLSLFPPSTSLAILQLPGPSGSLSNASTLVYPAADLPYNITLPSTDLNSSLSGTVKVGCDAARFGRDPVVKSCRNVFGFMRPSDEMYSFSQRGDGRSSDIELPFRTYSSKLSEWAYISLHADSALDDAKCVLQPFLRDGAMVGHASSSEVILAAGQILQACVVRRGTGGLAYNIGTWYQSISLATSSSWWSNSA